MSIARQTLAPGDKLPTYRHPVERCVFVVAGSLEVRVAGDSFNAGPEHLIAIPAGVSNQIHNVGRTQSVHLDVYLPTPDPGTVLDEPCAPTSDPAPANTLRPVTEAGFTFPKEGDTGLAVHWLARRETGSRAAVNVIQSQPGSGSPPLHIHEFVQVYFQLAGELTARVAGVEYTLAAGDMVAIPPGVAHEQQNMTDRPERHFTVNSREPAAPMSEWDPPVEFQRK
ncbi:cupin domain-containing protein [Streptomyces sp. NPDC002144]